MRGERHPKARASDEVVRRARYLRETEKWTIGMIAQTLGVDRKTVAKWLDYSRRRLAVPEDFEAGRRHRWR